MMASFSRPESAAVMLSLIAKSYASGEHRRATAVEGRLVICNHVGILGSGARVAGWLRPRPHAAEDLTPCAVYSPPTDPRAGLFSIGDCSILPRASKDFTSATLTEFVAHAGFDGTCPARRLRAEKRTSTCQQPPG